MLTKAPEGLDEIIYIFGSLTNTYESKYIVSFTLPYPLLYNFLLVKTARCHKLLVENFSAVFEEIKNQGLQDLVQHFGGIYSQRSIRGEPTHPSTHSWGIAIDLEPEKYPLGSLKRFDTRIIDIFHSYNFFYGGDFKSRKDGMHFQFCTKY
jgi:hypothetical protein